VYKKTESERWPSVAYAGMVGRLLLPAVTAALVALLLLGSARLNDALAESAVALVAGQRATTSTAAHRARRNSTRPASVAASTAVTEHTNAFPPPCPALSFSPAHHARPRLPVLARTARVVNQTWLYDRGLRELVLRVAVGPQRLGAPFPEPDSCTDRVRASLFSRQMAIAATTHTLAYKHTTPGSAFDVVVTVVVPCDAPDVMQLHMTLEWEHWSVSTQRFNITAVNATVAYLNRLQTLGYSLPWPPLGAVVDDNALRRNASVSIPACPPALAAQTRPLCNASLDLDVFAGAFYVTTLDNHTFVKNATGTLGKYAVNMHATTWTLGNETVVWQPHACDFDHDWHSAAVLDKLGPGLVLFLGDSTLEELFMLVVEQLRMGAWHPAANNRSMLVGAYGDVHDYALTRQRMFDARFGATRLRFMWNASPQPYLQASLGLASFDDALFQAQLDAFLTVDADVAQQCASLPCAAPRVVINSGLHDLITDNFSFDVYERRLRAVLRNLTQRGARVLVVSSSPKFLRYVNSHGTERLGTPGVRVLNEIAERVALSVPGVTWADIAAPRMLAPYDGDGHHCISHYEKYLKPWWRAFGMSCVWRMRGLVTLLARLARVAVTFTYT